MSARKPMTPTAKAKARSASAHAARVKKVYGLSRADYETVLEAQDGACAICRGKRPYRLCVDHDHATGEVRGLLCRRCNKLLRDVRDNVLLLNGAVIYLTVPPVREALGRKVFAPVTSGVGS